MPNPSGFLRIQQTSRRKKMAETSYQPKKFAVIGAGPVGGIVSAFLAKGGYEVTLCDIVPELLAPALDPGITLEGIDNLQAKVTSPGYSGPKMALYQFQKIKW